ncbi:MAG: UDP-glucose 4-epimerase GalE [Saprospiraceae bacterium]|nr:UDP-glucose 4-epimerase GalE [Saprospiraceae bacterium]
MKVLVTGACGYIGSHTVVDLIENGFDVVSVDAHFNSDPSVLEQIEKITGVSVPHYPVNLVDREKTRKIFEDHPDIKGIIHFAALKLVGESVEKPLEYFDNNLNSLLNILWMSKEFKVEHLIFSSSCSVYGNATELPVTEQTPLQEAESPYARTKQMGEQIIKDFSRSYEPMDFILLRYFNPAGAHTSNLLGESPVQPAANLVPVITETAIGKRKSMTVFGDDYETRDGSCVRDYIHVMDLANAHTKALQYLEAHKNQDQVEVFNLGIGEGATVLEAIHAFEKVTGEKLNYEIGPRRPGDVVAIYSNYEAAKNKLGWSPKMGIEEIMETAWEWERRRSGEEMS